MCVIALASGGCANGSNEEPQALMRQMPTFTDDGVPIEYVSPMYVVDVYDPVVAAAEADYVFIGKVEALNGSEQAFGLGSIPRTNFSVTVLENLKGDLITDEPIEVKQSGGFGEKDGKYYILNDLPIAEEGGVYMMMAYTQHDGTLLMSGPNSCVPLEIQSEAVNPDALAQLVISDEVYEKFMVAVDESKGQPSQNVLSKYDINPAEPESGEQTYRDFAEQNNAEAKVEELEGIKAEFDSERQGLH
jgi:hypothetical protein